MRRERLVTAATQKARVEEILAVYRSQGIAVHCDLRRVPLHGLIATQDGIEAEKLQVVARLVQEGKLNIPVVVEEHFLNDRLIHYLLDGHCRVRSLIEAGKTSVDAYVLWSPAGTFRSHFIEVARQYGDVRVKDLPLV